MEWVFRSSIQKPSGLRIESIVVFPTSEIYKDFMEVNEIVQMGAYKLLQLVDQHLPKGETNG